MWTRSGSRRRRRRRSRSSSARSQRGTVTSPRPTQQAALRCVRGVARSLHVRTAHHGRAEAPCRRGRIARRPHLAAATTDDVLADILAGDSARLEDLRAQRPAVVADHACAGMWDATDRLMRACFEVNPEGVVASPLHHTARLGRIDRVRISTCIPHFLRENPRLPEHPTRVLGRAALRWRCQIAPRESDEQ